MADETFMHVAIDREKTAPFLIRTFVKINGFHRLSLFEDGTLPTTDEHQLFTWKDATLGELITTLRITSTTPEYRHPLAKFFFRVLYADSLTKGHFSRRDLGQITAREMLEDSDASGDNKGLSKTLEELRFVAGDYLCIAVHLPKNVNLGSSTTALTIKGSAATTDKWSRGGPSQAPPGGLGRGGAHWRARPGISAPAGRGGGPNDDSRTWKGRDRDVSPPRPRRNSPLRSRPPIPDRGFDKSRPGRRSRSRSRSRPRSRSRSPRRRLGRYDRA